MSSFEDDPTVDNFETWYDTSVEDEQPKDEDFRFLKIHPVLVGFIEFFLLLPMRILVLISFILAALIRVIF